MATEAQIRANRENAKKGGRKKGVVTLEREKARQYIAEHIGEYMPQLFEVLIKKSVVDEDVAAMRELFDRGFGRATQAIDVTTKNEAPSTLTKEEEKTLLEIEKKLSKEN